MSNKQLRQTLRWIHIALGVMIALYIYSPLGDDATYTLLTQILVLPVVSISGLMMWQQAAISRWRRNRANQNDERATA